MASPQPQQWPGQRREKSPISAPASYKERGRRCRRRRAASWLAHAWRGDERLHYVLEIFKRSITRARETGLGEGNNLSNNLLCGGVGCLELLP
jgi:hypothetical protein